MEGKNQSVLLSSVRNRLLGEAGKLDFRVGATQAAVLLANLAAVLAPPSLGDLLVLLTSLLAVAWLFFSYRHVQTRSIGERARRAALAVDGLGFRLDPDSLREILAEAQSLCPRGLDWKSFEQPDYFASAAPPGKTRLAELLHECAFWSAELHLAAARTLKEGSAAALLFSFLSLFAAIYWAGSGAMLGTLRFVLAFCSFLVSGEVLLRAFRHSSHGISIRAVELRVAALRRHSAARSESAPDIELLLALGDYNSEVEAAPMIPGWLFRRNRDRLNQLWALK